MSVQGKIVSNIKGSLLADFIIPATYAKAFEVKQGQVLNIVQVEGPQMVDAVFLNARDLKEVFHAGWTAALNMINGTGTMQKVAKLYSKPPRENVMLEVVEDPVGVHLAWNGGRCSRGFYEADRTTESPQLPGQPGGSSGTLRPGRGRCAGCLQRVHERCRYRGRQVRDGHAGLEEGGTTSRCAPRWTFLPRFPPAPSICSMIPGLCRSR